MDCPFAYEKKNIDYILCKKEPEPSRNDRAKLFHAMCAHQVDCPKQSCRKLSSNWGRCAKLRATPKTAYEDVLPDIIEEPDELLKPARKSRRKAKSEE